MDRYRTLRNVAIVLGIAAAVYILSGPAGGPGLETFTAVLWVGFGVGIAYVGLRLYREHRISVHSLGDRHRGMFYGAIALAVFAYAARRRMWETGLGELVWFVLVALVIYSLLEVYRYSRSY
jgi:hypothetical protein